MGMSLDQTWNQIVAPAINDVLALIGSGDTETSNPPAIDCYIRLVHLIGKDIDHTPITEDTICCLETTSNPN
jgi:hypothetical protein